MNKTVSLHVADDASPEDRRGKLIGTAHIEEGVTHTCIVPEDMSGSELYDYIVHDFLTTDSPLYPGHELEDRRELAATKRAQRQRQAQRDAEEAERQAAEARKRAEEAQKQAEQ